jgi:hypothetical protein
LRFLTVVLTTFLASCSGDAPKAVVRGELMPGFHLRECETGNVYALVFPSELALEFTRKVDSAPPGQPLIASVRAYIGPSPPESDADGSLGVIGIQEVAPGSCPQR